MTISGSSHSPGPMPSRFLMRNPRSAPRLVPGESDDHCGPVRSACAIVLCAVLSIRMGHTIAGLFIASAYDLLKGEP